MLAVTATRPRAALPGLGRRLPGGRDRTDAADHAAESRRGCERASDRRAHSFYVGVAVNPSADDLELELERFEQKLEAGARFAMTQVLFDLAYLDRFLERLGGSSPIPLLVGVWPLWSHQLARRVHNEVPGIVVPEPVQQALLDAGADAAAEGMRVARRLYAEAREKAAGVYVVAPFRQPLNALGILDDS